MKPRINQLKSPLKFFALVILLGTRLALPNNQPTTGHTTFSSDKNTSEPTKHHIKQLICITCLLYIVVICGKEITYSILLKPIADFQYTQVIEALQNDILELRHTGVLIPTTQWNEFLRTAGLIRNEKIALLNRSWFWRMFSRQIDYINYMNIWQKKCNLFELEKEYMGQ